MKNETDYLPVNTAQVIVFGYFLTEDVGPNGNFLQIHQIRRVQSILEEEAFMLEVFLSKKQDAKQDSDYLKKDDTENDVDLSDDKLEEMEEREEDNNNKKESDCGNEDK